MAIDFKKKITPMHFSWSLLCKQLCWNKGLLLCTLIFDILIMLCCLRYCNIGLHFWHIFLLQWNWIYTVVWRRVLGVSIEKAWLVRAFDWSPLRNLFSSVNPDLFWFLSLLSYNCRLLKIWTSFLLVSKKNQDLFSCGHAIRRSEGNVEPAYLGLWFRLAKNCIDLWVSRPKILQLIPFAVGSS